MTWITRLCQRIAKAREQQRAIELLESFNAARLRDLGISRDEIVPYVCGTEHRPGSRPAVSPVPPVPPLLLVPALPPVGAEADNVVPFPSDMAISRPWKTGTAAR
ncbi:MAG: hypothetical protein AAF416_01700 [Pseudomonadota bacterium]